MRPRVVLSRCLEMEACRYNGQGIRSDAVREMEPYLEYVPVCPEVRIGLGVPRDPIRIQRASSGGGLRLVQPSTERDLTERMVGFGHAFADAAESVDGLLLKSRSPSCGIGDVKIYAGEAPEPDRGWGMFAAVMRERYPDVAMADEARLTDADDRHGWLTRVFASARLRRALARGAAGLTAFHEWYAPLLATRSPEAERALDGLAERARSASAAALASVAAEYRSELARALAGPASRGPEPAGPGAFRPYPDGLGDPGGGRPR